MSAPSIISIRCAGFELSVQAHATWIATGVSIWVSAGDIAVGSPILSPADARALAAALIQQSDAVEPITHTQETP